MLASPFHEAKSMSAPIFDLTNKILANASAIQDWLDQEWKSLAAPFYASVDLRNCGYKIAPVDINLFPGGFNNLASNTDPQCLREIIATIDKTSPGARQVL